MVSSPAQTDSNGVMSMKRVRECLKCDALTGWQKIVVEKEMSSGRAFSQPLVS